MGIRRMFRSVIYIFTWKNRFCASCVYKKYAGKHGPCSRCKRGSAYCSKTNAYLFERKNDNELSRSTYSRNYKSYQS